MRFADSVAVSPDGESVYGGRRLIQFDRSSSSGALEFVRSYHSADGPIALTGRGNFLYASVEDGVARFKRNSITGRLTRIDCVTGSTWYAEHNHCRKTPTATKRGPGSGLDSPVALAATKRRVYVAARDDYAIARLAVKRRR